MVPSLITRHLHITSTLSPGGTRYPSAISRRHKAFEHHWHDFDTLLPGFARYWGIDCALLGRCARALCLETVPMVAHPDVSQVNLCPRDPTVPRSKEPEIPPEAVGTAWLRAVLCVAYDRVPVLRQWYHRYSHDRCTLLARYFQAARVTRAPFPDGTRRSNTIGTVLTRCSGMRAVLGR